MSRKGDPYDDAVAEFFFSCLKCKLIHPRRFKTRHDAYCAIFVYIAAFYNTVRQPHSSIGWLSPFAFKRRLTA